MRKFKLNLRQLFSNTKFLIVFSIVVAFVFWIVVALEYAPVVENEIKDIPVKIDMDNSVPDKMGLQVFGQSDYTISITVKGNRYVVGGDLLTADDFEATAQTAYVDSAGKHNLIVKVTAKDANADYEIVSKSADYIEVFFDKYAEKEVEVIPRIVSELDEYTDDNYLFDDKEMICTAKTVKLSGAQTEINSIGVAYADVEINKRLTQSETVDAKLTFSGNDFDLETKYVKANNESGLTVPVTLPVYKIENLSTSVLFKDAPSDYINNSLGYSISPSTVRVAVLQNGAEDLDSLNVGTVSFSQISPSSNSFTFDASELKNAKLLDSTSSFKVRINTTAFSINAVDVNADTISIKGSDGIGVDDVKLSSIGKIYIVGKDNNPKKISEDMLNVTIDLTDITLRSGDNTVPVTVTLNNSTSCWIYGTYTAIISF